MEKQCNLCNLVQIPTGIEVYAEHLGVCRAQCRARRRIEKDADHYDSVFTRASNFTSAVTSTYRTSELQLIGIQIQYHLFPVPITLSFP